VFFSEGYPIDIMLALPTPTRELLDAATRANTSIYSVDPRGLHSMAEETMEMQHIADTSLGLDAASGLRSEQRLAADSLRILSDEPLGRAAVDTNDFKGAFERIVKDNSSYYMLGYQSTNDRRDGRFRQLKTTVKRPAHLLQTPR